MPDIAALQGELLDAALMPAEWYPTLGKLQHGFEASHCDLYLMQGETLLFAAGVGIDVSMSEYIERFIDREPRSLELRHLKTGEVTTDRQFASRKS